MGQYVEQGYQFDLTAPQINDILLMAREIPRPNLLHNSRFQVNQRGKTFPNTTPTSANDIPPDGVYQSNSVEINGFILDRWHAPSYGVTYNWDGTYGPDGTSVIKGTAGNNVAVFSQYLWTPGSRDASNIIFDKDITISILYKDGNLFTATGHTATRADWQSVANTGNVVSDKDIVAMDGDIEVMRFTCRKTSSNSSIMQAAFLLEINQRNSGIVAAKVEIGVGQTLAIKVGNRWKLIDRYNYHDDLKICQRFYGEYIITHGVVVCENVGAQSTKEKYMICASFSKNVDMVFTPTIVDFSRAYIIRADGSNNVEISNPVTNVDYNDKISSVTFDGVHSVYIGLRFILKDNVVSLLNFETGSHKYKTYIVYLSNSSGSSSGGADMTSYGINYNPVSVTFSAEI